MTLPAGAEQPGAVNGVPATGANPPAQGAQAAQPGTPLTVESMMAALQPVLAGVVKDTVARQMKSAMESLRTEPQAAPEGAANASAPPPAKKSAGDPTDEVAALRTRLDRAEAATAAEKVRADEQARAASLKATIGKHGVVDLEQVFRIVSPDLKPGKDGQLYATAADGGYITADEYVAGVLKSSPHLLRSSGAGGSGGTGGDRNSGGNSGAEISYFDYVEQLKKLDGDPGAIAALVKRVGRGELKIKGA